MDNRDLCKQKCDEDVKCINYSISDFTTTSTKDGKDTKKSKVECYIYHEDVDAVDPPPPPKPDPKATVKSAKPDPKTESCIYKNIKACVTGGDIKTHKKKKLAEC